MEEDRAVADLGPGLATDINGDAETVPKTPKRRFIGRKAADAKAAARAAETGSATIEETGAVQGAVYFCTIKASKQAD